VNPQAHIAVAVVEHRGRYLVGLREGDVPLSGYSEFPGGKVRPGESPAEAAARECREETGIDVEIEKPFPPVRHRYDHGELHIDFFACRPRDPDRVPEAPFRWILAAELDALRFPEANREILAALARRVER
jgi:mutator protein MutT